MEEGEGKMERIFKTCQEKTHQNKHIYKCLCAYFYIYIYAHRHLYVVNTSQRDSFLVKGLPEHKEFQTQDRFSA